MTDRNTLTGFEGEDIRTLIDSRVAERSQHPWLIWEPFAGESRQWCYAEFGHAIRRFAAGLQARGVEPGERVLVHLTNSPESVIAWLGCAYAGAVPVTTNAGSSLSELAYFAAHARAVAGVTQPQFAALVHQAAPSLKWLAVTDTDSGAAPTAVIPATSIRFADIDGDPENLLRRPHDPMASFGIQYTSGTTARPKAVVWTHANALWGARLSAWHENLRPDDVHLVLLPMFHTNAQVYSVLASLWTGSRIVLQPRFSASRFWAVAVKYRCTVTSIVPFCIRALSGHASPPEHYFRLWCSAYSDPGLEKRYGLKTIGWWGMTETVTHGIVGSTCGPNAPTSMGRPSPGYEILVLDEHGHPTLPGGTGELFVRGRRGVSLFLEYADDPAATANAFPQPDTLATGDRVRLDAQGFLYFADRGKDMLKVGGENVAASEIEQLLARIEGVSEVAVVGRPDEMLDEVPVAFVIGAESDSLRERIRVACDEHLALFKRPREIYFVDTLPRSTLEKVSKADLRARLVEPRP